MRGAAGALLGACILLAGIGVAAADDEPVVPLPDRAAAWLEPLGPGVIGAALPAGPILEPSSLRHLAAGTWIYRIVTGAAQGQIQTVRVEPLPPDEPGTWQVVTDDTEVQRLRVTANHRIEKLSQSDDETDRLVVYRPGIVLEPGMRAGEAKTVKGGLSTYAQDRPDKVEYEGNLEYTVRYVGAYRVSTPAGLFEARLLHHEYTMKIGPATATYESYGFYADDVGNVAEVSRESVSALLVYRRSTDSGRVLLTAPAQ